MQKYYTFEKLKKKTEKYYTSGLTIGLRDVEDNDYAGDVAETHTLVISGTVEMIQKIFTRGNGKSEKIRFRKVTSFIIFVNVM